MLNSKLPKYLEVQTPVGTFSHLFCWQHQHQPYSVQYLVY